MLVNGDTIEAQAWLTSHELPWVCCQNLIFCFWTPITTTAKNGGGNGKWWSFTALWSAKSASDEAAQESYWRAVAVTMAETPKNVDSMSEEILFKSLWSASLVGGPLWGSSLLKEHRHCTRAVVSHCAFGFSVFNFDGGLWKWKSEETKWFAVGFVAWGP